MIERDFYRLPELAQRWGCSVDDLIHLGGAGRAEICINAYGISTEVSFQDGRPWGTCRRAMAHPAGLFTLYRDTLRSAEVSNGSPVEVSYAINWDGKFESHCVFDPPIKMDVSHLCLLRVEVQRLDRERFNPPAPTAVMAPKSESASTRDRNTLLMILHAMAAAAPYKFDPHAKRSEAASTIASATDAAGCSVTPETIRDKLREAAELFGNANSRRR